MCIRDRAESVGWVSGASVSRLLPDTLLVTVNERPRLAVWQSGGVTSVVDPEGHVIPEADPGRFPDLPLVVGEGAADDAIVMVRSLERYPQITKDLAALSRIGDRRWDLIFYSGLRVQLPENGVAQALHQLDMYQTTDQLLDRDVTVIDMRVAGMVSLKLGELALKAEDDAIKAAKKKKPVAHADSDYETPAEKAAEAKPQ